MNTRLLLIPLALICMAASCRKVETPSPEESVLRQLAAQYKNGRINRCMHNGKTVYTGEINAYDAGSVVYDAAGKQIGTCNYAWGQPDPICDQLSDCKVIWCTSPNIWGQDAVNLLGFTP